MAKAATIRDSIKKLTKLIHISVSADLEKFGLTRPQLLVLQQIFLENKTIGQISKALELSYSTVSGIIDRLERGGYLKRIKDVNDRRVIWIEKTEKLSAIYQELPTSKEEYYSELFDCLSEEEIDTFLKTLQVLIDQIEKKVEEKL